MRCLYTTFSDHKPPKPLIAHICDSNIEAIPLYQRGTGLTLAQVNGNKEKIVKLFESPLYVNDFKKHLWAFDLPLTTNYEVWNSDFKLADPVETVQQMATKVPALWEQLLANASIVYQSMQNRGVYVGYEHINPIYGFTLTGRSKSTGYNIHNSSDDIRLHPDSDELLIHFDWLSADIRACSLLAQDPAMEETFKTSNPYAIIAEQLGESDRDTVKKAMIESLYSLNVDAPVVSYYEKFHQWMCRTIESMDNNGYTETILGKRFYINQMPDKERARKTVFNAAIQGTVAHAMQNVLVQLESLMPGTILAEIYDSIVIVCDKRSARDTIEHAIKIIRQPLSGLYEHNPVFPVRVSIGKHWRQWKQYKEYR